KAERHKTETFATLTVAGQQWLDGDRKPDLGARQVEALEQLRGAPEGLRVADLSDRGAGLDTLKRLARRELVTLRHERVDRDPFEHAAGVSPDAETLSRTLTGAQQAAFAQLLPLIDGGF